jgi:hypothetical protein
MRNEQCSKRNTFAHLFRCPETVTQFIDSDWVSQINISVVNLTVTLRQTFASLHHILLLFFKDWRSCGFLVTVIELNIEYN